MSLPTLPATLLAWQESTTTAANIATRASPNSDSNGGIASGIEIVNAAHYVVTVSADLGQLLTGTGWMYCWRYSLALQRWTRNPDLDFPITPANGETWANMRDRACVEFDIGVNFGRMLWAPSGVTVDAGNVTTTVEAAKANGLTP